jgi:hypothetical protein
MEKNQLEALKQLACSSVSEMLDKMFVETDVNDDYITVSIAGHDIKGHDLSLNQYSTEIKINDDEKTVSSSFSKFIRYPNYFGKATREFIRRANEELLKTIKDFINKEPIERAKTQELNTRELSQGRALRALEDGLRTLESTGFSGETTQRLINTIRNRRDRYDESLDEQQERIANRRNITEAEVNALVEGRNNEIVDDEEDTIVDPHDIDRAGEMIRQHLNDIEDNITFISPAMRQQLVNMAIFEDINEDIMNREIDAFNNIYSQRDPAGQMPAANDETEPQEEVTTGIINHDQRAIEFIEEWYGMNMTDVGIISQNDYHEMSDTINRGNHDGIYLFALDRVVGRHNATLTANRIQESNPTNVRVNLRDSALRLFAHVTGSSNPETDSIGRYVDGAMRRELHASADRNNIPRAYMDWAIETYDDIYRDEPLRSLEAEQSRQSDIFINANYPSIHIINDEDRLEMIHRAELFGIDTEVFISRLDAHNREAERLQALNPIPREVDEISQEDLEAAEERYDQLVREPLTENPNIDPHNDDDRI